MKTTILLCILFLLPVMSNCQNKGIRVLPEIGFTNPIGDFREVNAFAAPGLQYGLNIEKMWGKFGLGLYGGIDKNNIKTSNILPQTNSSLSILQSNVINQNYWKQFQFGIGPILNLDISKKFNLEFTSKFGMSDFSYPDFRQLVEVGAPLNQTYTLYETNNEEIEKNLYPMLLTTTRLNFKLSSKLDLALSASYKNVRNVRHAYSFLDGGFDPGMSNEELAASFLSAPTVSIIRECSFNSFGVSLGLSYTFGETIDKGNPEIDSTDNNTDQDSCLNPLIRNSGFAFGINRASSVPYWKTGYGSPKFLNTIGGGCFDPGHVEASGNQIKGDAISQVLLPTNGILLGKKYMLSVGVRFHNKSRPEISNRIRAVDYARIRAIAYNGVLPTTGNHPAPSSNVAIIGRSGKIKDCGDWSIVEFPVWIANKNFSNIAINVFTNENASATLLIDNVTICEVSDDYDCDELQLDASGNPIIPPGYGNVLPGFVCTSEAEEDEYDNGSLQDLYGQLYGYDGTDNWYVSAFDKCFSIGGTLPDEVVNYNCDDSLKMLGIDLTCAELEKLLAKAEKIDTTKLDKLPFLPPLPIMTDDCATDLPPNFSNMAFEGRDIIYIHGLQLNHLCDRANKVPGAVDNWPFSPNEFYNGYYKTEADTNWAPHIDYFLRGKGNKNRYLIVTYNCSQPAEIAVHSVLSQIRHAMETGKGVMADSTDFRGTSCFARDYVFVSHSTGAIIADAALTTANFTKIVKAINLKFGDISLISDRCKGRVSLHGAYTGSSLATLLVGVQNFPVLSGIASAGLTKFVCKTDFSLLANHHLVFNSILVDLIPPITRAKWGPLIAAVPVPVINVSGGHPSAIISVLKYGMHIGFDDGVVSMDCANTVINQPTNFAANFPTKVFDMGIPKMRGIHYYLDQRLSFNIYGASSTPYLSPTGMVQPVATAAPIFHAPNHFSFVQAASEHLQPTDISYFSTCSYEETKPGHSRNYEEELVISDGSVFSKGLVNTSIISEMHEEIRGKYIWYPRIKIKMVRGFPRLIIYWKKFYIWKRTYHTLRDNCMYDCDYVYKYLFNN